MIITAKRHVLPLHHKLIFAPLGDIHFNAPGHDREQFKDIIQWIAHTGKKDDRQIMVPLMGDELELMSRSERRGYKSSGLHESTRAWLEKKLKDDLLEFIECIKPIGQYLSTVVCGNHIYKFQESCMGSWVGKSVSRIVAEHYGVPYLGICGVNVLELTPFEGSTESHPFKILMHHGFGSASTKGNSIMQMIKLKDRFPACNLYVMGHNHVKIGTTTEGIDFKKNKKTGQWEMCSMVQAFVRSASFLKGYMPGEVVEEDSGSYVEEACYVPAGLGIVTSNLRWNVSRDKAGRSRPMGFKIHTQE